MSESIDRRNLLKISDLARETGVSTATIKFYMREGLLPKATLKTGRNMAYYDRTFVERIRVIKELQQKRFLPLDVIRAILDRDSSVISEREIDTLLGVEGTFYEAIHYTPGREPLTRKQAIEKYDLNPKELQFSIDQGVLNPDIRAGVEYFEGDDLALLELFSKLNEAGFSTDLFPVESSLPVYVEAMDKLAEAEIKMFTRGVTGTINDAEVAQMALGGLKLIEDFIVLLRRKSILRAIQKLRRDNESTGTGE